MLLLLSGAAADQVSNSPRRGAARITGARKGVIVDGPCTRCVPALDRPLAATVATARGAVRGTRVAPTIGASGDSRGEAEGRRLPRSSIATC